VELKIPAEALKDFAGPGIRALGRDQFEVLFRFKPGKKVDAVALAGSFNNWNAKALALEGPDKDGFYGVKQTLTRGTYEYKFVVNGSEWLTDPTNLRTSGTVRNSVLTLGSE
jgi:1,4-alpha-glucan branching enzyme